MELLKPSPESLDKAVATLKVGGVIVCPTDTVYGFLADATNQEAVEKIYQIKQRPKENPLPVFVKDIAMAEALADVNGEAANLLHKNWPGKVTFVLQRKPGATLYGQNKDTIALRVPSHDFLTEFLKEIDIPLAQTSVNISTQPPLTKIQDIVDQFQDNKLISLIIDGGDLGQTSPSKIFDVTQPDLPRLR